MRVKYAHCIELKSRRAKSGAKYITIRTGKIGKGNPLPEGLVGRYCQNEQEQADYIALLTDIAIRHYGYLVV